MRPRGFIGTFTVRRPTPLGSTSLVRRSRCWRRRDGRLIITTPNPWFWGSTWDALFDEPRVNAEHTAVFSIGMLREQFRRHRFVIEHAQYGNVQDLRWAARILPRRIRCPSIWVVARLADGEGLRDRATNPAQGP